MNPIDPKALLTALVAEGVDFVLVGGLAAALRGTTRITQDIDLVYATPAANLTRLCTVVNRFAPRRMELGKASGRAFVVTPEHLKKEPLLQLMTDVGEVDLLRTIRGFNSYGFLKKNSEVLEHLGFPLCVLSVDGLIRAKRSMHRGKDLQDIVELEAIKEVEALTDER